MDFESIKTIANLMGVHPMVIVGAVIWALAWKGMALWRAALLRQKGWFVAILLINTLGILELIYLYVVSRKYKVEFVEEK